MYAVIKTGGKQYRVAPNDTLLIEKLEGAPGDIVAFDEVLLLAGGDDLQVGAPLIEGASVIGEIARQERGPRLIVFKKKRRHHYRRRNGHRQDLTSVRIVEFLTGGAKPEREVAESEPVVEMPVMASEMPASLADPVPVAEIPGPEAAAAPAIEAAVVPARADDLSLIGGIGPKINAALTGLGYTTYAQIAALTREEIETLETALKMKGRVAREEWIEQARELMAGKPPRAKADKARKNEA